MGIDLMSVFKAEKAKPEVAAVIVFANPDATVAEAVRQSIADAGFITDKVQKSDEGETTVYGQADMSDENMVMVRLSDQMIVAVNGLPAPTGLFNDMVEEHGFFPGLTMALEAFHGQIAQIVEKSDNPHGDTKNALAGLGDYLHLLASLPAACFKADTAVQATTLAAAKKQQEADDAAKPPIPKPETDVVVTKEVPGLEANGTTVVTEKQEATVPDDKTKEAVPAKTVTTEEKTVTTETIPAEKTAVQKSDLQQVLDALTASEDKTALSLTDLATKVETIATDLAAQKKVVDGVVTKADTLENTLKGTVIAPATREDRPVGETTVTRKADDDPRTGNFDTAFLRRKRN